MSLVTGITLHMSCAEDYTEQDDGPDIVYLVEQINSWLAERRFGPLVSVEDHFGGNKHPQMLVYGAGFNFFLEDDFERFVMSLPWQFSQNVVLLINPQEGPVRVCRPIRAHLVEICLQDEKGSQ